MKRIESLIHQFEQGFTLQAIDIDGGKNGKIIFHIADVRPQTLMSISKNIANPTEIFLINPISGELRLNLSSENTSQRLGEYSLEIEVRKAYSFNIKDKHNMRVELHVIASTHHQLPYHRIIILSTFFRPKTKENLRYDLICRSM